MGRNLTAITTNERPAAFVVEALPVLRDKLLHHLASLPEVGRIEAAPDLGAASESLHFLKAAVVIVHLDQVRYTDWETLDELKRQRSDTTFIGFTTLRENIPGNTRAAQVCDAVVPLLRDPKQLRAVVRSAANRHFQPAGPTVSA